MDRRPCEFYAVTDKEILRNLASVKKAGAAMLEGSATAVVVAVDPDKADTWIEDSSIALTYIHLMAADQGMGSCWIQLNMRQSADGIDAEENTRNILSLPDRYRILGILSLGIPAESKSGKKPEELDYSKSTE